jgi:hypothetical protein
LGREVIRLWAADNGMVTTYSYDDLNRLTDETVSNNANSNLIFKEHIDFGDDGLRSDGIDTRYNASGAATSATETVRIMTPTAG